MPWASRAAAFFRRLLHRQKIEEELDAEVQAHLELLIERYLAKGLSYQDARRSARLEFGGPEQVKQTVREARAGAAIEASLQDVRYALRVLRKWPGFTTAAASTLALGIGMTTAIFSLVNTIFLRPLPFPDPSRIVLFTTSSPTGLSSAASPIKFNFWRQQTAVFEDISGYRFGRINMTGVEHPEQIQSALVSADYFRLFGLSIMRGRSFSGDEDRPGNSGVVVVSDGFCKRIFGRDTGIIGRTISLGGRPHEIIGITSPGTHFESPAAFDPSSAAETTDVWMPLQIDPDSSDQNGYFSVAARIKPGVMIETAAAQLKLGTQDFRRRFPRVDGMPSGSAFTVQSMKDVMLNGELAPLSVLSGAVSLLLLIACANVANLLLARAVGRQREIAIRSAVGATRGRIIRQLLTEGAVLSAFGGVLGLILGIFGIRAFLSIHTMTLSIPRIGDHGSAIILDWRVLFFTALISLTTGMLLGLIPALQAYRTDLTDALKDGSGYADTGFHHNKVRSLLVVSQIAIALVLLAGSGLLIRSFIALRSVSPGFDPRNILTMRISLTAPQFQKTSTVSEFVREGVRRINALPGVVSAAATCCLPLEDRTVGDVIIADRPLDGRSHGTVNVSTISPNYFDVFRIPVRRGRGFTDRDVRGAPSVVVISEAMARRFWQRGTTFGDPLNERLVFPDLPASAWQIVGVVGDTHGDGLSQSAPPTIYVPIAQAPDDFTAYLVRSPIAWVFRTRGERSGLSLAIQKELEQASGGLPVGDIRSMDQILVRSTGGREFNMLLLSILGGSALVLAAIGIYGLIAYSVQHRTKEIGIRMALGAQLNDMRNMVLMQGFRLTLLGIAIGIPAALSLTRLIKRFLFGLQPQDPGIFIAVSALLSTVAIFAVWLAARRACLPNPVDALHHE